MREIKPTQKPVPSSDVKDLFFNSGKIDEWVNSLQHEYTDRFGKCHKTAVGMEWIFNELIEKFNVDINQAIIAAGYITIDSFQQGADLPSNELTQRNHILRDETTGEYYRWDGDLPKQVPAGSTPQSTGGIGKGAWVSVGDASLRGYLKDGDGSLVGLTNGTLKDAIKFVTPEMYGAIPWESDDISSTDFVDSYQNLQAMFDSGYPVLLTKKYVTSKPLLIEKGIRIDGNGSNRCGIYKSTNTSSGMGEFLSPSGGGKISYDVDAVLIIKKPTQGYVGCLNWSGFRVSKCGNAYKENNHEYEGVGIFAPYISESTLKDVVSFGFKTPFYNINSWMNNFIRVHAHGHEGFIIGGRGGEPDEGGTTTTLSNCWSTATGEGLFPWNFNKMWQVQLTGCASEYVGDGDHVAGGIIRAQSSYVVINGMDIERAHVKKFIEASLSYIDFSGYNTYSCSAKYADMNTYLIDVHYSRVLLRNGGMYFERDTEIPAVNSNFARVHGGTAFLGIESSVVVPQVTQCESGSYTPKENDFVVYCREGGTFDGLFIPQSPPEKTIRLVNTSIDFLAPCKTSNYEEYADTNSLRGLNYSTVFIGRDAANKGTSGDAYLLNFTNGNSDLTRNNSYQIEFNTTATQVKFRGALWSEDKYTNWREFYTTANTTKDSNGNLKAASPIVKLFADHIETNDEAEGVTMQKLGTGHYLIKGVVGFNADGAWGINNGFVIPQDHNGKNMVLIDYEVRPDGDIEVFVFHQQNADLPERFQNKRIKYIDKDGNPVYYENYEPCDVPESRWIDMRVEMPPNSIYNLKQAEAERLAKEEAERQAEEAKNAEIEAEEDI
ncbi:MULTISPECIES: hypothetical protein [unclassified Providencia]|uniref:phage tail fiber protein n=1 Tax=unclassified Providencia TaxID=2633465 RepID=UPI0029904078|nr:MULTISPECIES: hypothetical protein [unclassified Providencia]